MKDRKHGSTEIERVRRICLNLPETWEKISHGEPTWFVGKKVFAMFSNNHHDDGHIAVTIPAAIGVQEALIRKSPKKFYRPPYVGVRGWVGIEVSRVTDKELRLHLQEAWRLIAPPKFQQLLPREVAPESEPQAKVRPRQRFPKTSRSERT